MSELREDTSGAKGSEFGHLAGKYLTFKLDDEEYGLDIMKVQEIIGIMPVTKVPRVPEYVRGVINLRGRIIPTIELRKKFGLESVEDTERTCIIVVELQTDKGKVNMGILVDEVAEVMDFASDNIDAAPEFGTALNTNFILGIGIVKGSVKILLDLDKVLNESEVHTVESIARSQNATAS